MSWADMGDTNVNVSVVTPEVDVKVGQLLFFVGKYNISLQIQCIIIKVYENKQKKTLSHLVDILLTSCDIEFNREW